MKLLSERVQEVHSSATVRIADKASAMRRQWIDVIDFSIGGVMESWEDLRTGISRLKEALSEK